MISRQQDEKAVLVLLKRFRPAEALGGRDAERRVPDGPERASLLNEVGSARGTEPIHAAQRAA
jgi:hypothetical protein